MGHNRLRQQEEMDSLFKTIDDIYAIAEDTSSLSDEIRDSSIKMKKQSNTLRQNVDQFKTNPALTPDQG